MAIVYIHRRKDIEDPFLNVFYVGIGKNEKRAYSKHSRNKLWNNIIKKHEYIVEITHKNILIEEAYAIEKYLIDFYGRHDLKSGNLSNLTDGGEGIINISKETRKKMSESRLGDKNHMYGRKGENHPSYGKKTSEETRKKLSFIFSGDKHPLYGKKSYFAGKKHTEETRKKISESKKGEKNPMFGKTINSSRFTGKKHSEETKQKMSLNNPMLGKKHTPEAILKIKLSWQKRKQKI